MEEKSKFNFNGFNKICHILNTITKMDVRLIDKNGNAILQIVNQIFQPYYKTSTMSIKINNTLRKNHI